MKNYGEMCGNLFITQGPGREIKERQKKTKKDKKREGDRKREELQTKETERLGINSNDIVAPKFAFHFGLFIFLLLLCKPSSLRKTTQ